MLLIRIKKNALYQNKEQLLFILDKEQNQDKEEPFVNHLLFIKVWTVYFLKILSEHKRLFTNDLTIGTRDKIMYINVTRYRDIYFYKQFYIYIL